MNEAFEQQLQDVRQQFGLDRQWQINSIYRNPVHQRFTSGAIRTAFTRTAARSICRRSPGGGRMGSSTPKSRDDPPAPTGMSSQRLEHRRILKSNGFRKAESGTFTWRGIRVLRATTVPFPDERLMALTEWTNELEGEPSMNGVIRQILPALILLTLSPDLGSAQSPDSLLQMLDAPDWRTRSQAVSRLNQVPVSELPAGAADRLIDLLAKTELDPPPESERKGEGFGEYQLALHRAALRLDDPSSLRAMALAGTGMSQEGNDFVASFGGEALPHLDEAWRVIDPLNRYAIIDTWALMLAENRKKLTDRDELQVRKRIMRAFEDPGLMSSGIRAAETASLNGAAPIVSAIADTSSGEILRSSAEQASQNFLTQRQSMSAADLAADLDTWLDAFCLDPEPGPKRGACRSLEDRLSTAHRHIEGGRDRPARNVLESFIHKVKQAHGQGAFTDAERTLLEGNAETLIQRLGGRR